MRYKSDNTDKLPQQEEAQYMPITCGSFNSGLAPMNYSNWMPNSKGYASPMAGQQMSTFPTTMTPATPLPSGYPSGGTATPLLPTASGQPSAIPTQNTQGMQGVQGMQTTQIMPTAQPAAVQVPSTVESPFFTPGFLRTQIGRKMRVEFLIGTNGFTDRTGTLVAVGASYILLRPIGSDDLMMCDIYSIKFVTILE
jgi:hypothetical protein